MIKYCNRCKYHIPYLEELKKEDETENGLNICFKTMTFKKNMIGEEAFVMAGSVDYCVTCGKITHDEREIIYNKCERKNQSMKCKDFLPKLKWRIASIFLRREKV